MIGAPTLLTVTTLGRFALQRDEGQLNGGIWKRRKVCDLFKLLISAEQHRLHREQVQELLWPSSASEQAASSFGKTLYLLRRALEPELATGKGGSSTYVLLERDTVMLLPNSMAIDADHFEQETRTLQARQRNCSGGEQETLYDECERVLALYGGEYLPEDLYEDWTQRRRDRLSRCYSWLLENAAQLAIANGMGQRACNHLQALLEHDPLDEQTHRQLMLTYARLGRRGDALNQFQQLRNILRTELRAQPLAETVATYRAIQNGQIAADMAPPLLISIKIPSTTESPSSPRDDVVQPQVNALEPNFQADFERIWKTTLVGRTEEMQQLQKALLTPAERPHVIFLSGEPGIGKTRLASEFARWASAEQRARVLRGSCYELSGTLPYQPIIETLDAYVRMSSPEQLRRVLTQEVADLAKIVPSIRARYPDLAPSVPQGPEAERRDLYNAVAQCFTTLAQEYPLVIVLDDLQWADIATIELLSYLVARPDQSIPGPQPLYVLLYRADEVHEQHPLRGLIATLSRLNGMEELRLLRLDESEVCQLVESIAGHPVGKAFTSEIYKHTEGNPFFIGETLIALVQEGKVKKINGQWQMTVDIHELALPQSARLLIERRLTHFPPASRRIFNIAAVMGRQFSSMLICQASNMSEEEIAHHVDNAIYAQIFTPLEGQNNCDLAFTHDKIREVLYQHLNPLRRRSLHRQTAQAIEKVYVNRLQPYYSTLAYHYQAAEDYARAVEYYLQAAHNASNVYAFFDAANCIERALDLLIGADDRPLRAELLRQLAADVYIYIGRPDKSVEAGLAACTLWRELGDMAKEAESWLDASFALHWQGRETEAITYIQRALDCLRDMPQELRLCARANVQWGMGAVHLGETAVAREKLLRTDELLTQTGRDDPFIGVVYLWSRSWYEFLSGTPAAMFDYAMRGAELCRTTQRFGWEPMLTTSAAWAAIFMGRIDEGVQIAQESLAKSIRHNTIGAQGWSYLVLAFAASQQGNWQETHHYSEQAMDIAQMLHDVDMQARVLLVRSISASCQQDWNKAILHIETALQVSRQNGEASMIYPYLLLQAATAHLYARQLEKAQWHLDQSMQLASDRGYLRLPAIAQRVQGQILLDQRRFEHAQPYFEQSLQALIDLGDVLEQAHTEEAFGEFFQARNRPGDSKRGTELFNSARSIFVRLGIKGRPGILNRSPMQ